MGCAAFEGANLRVCSLNFSGICLSPFEFHDSSIEKDQISAKFDELLKLELESIAKEEQRNKSSKKDIQESQDKQKKASKKFQFKVGDLDKIYQKERYTPIYNRSAGVEQGNLMTIKEFQQHWKEYYRRIKGDVKKKKESKLKLLEKQKADLEQQMKRQSTEEFNKQIKEKGDKIVQLAPVEDIMREEERQCMMFDVLCYKTILRIVYGDIDLEMVKDSDVSLYQKFMRRWHQKEYIKNSKKMEIVAKYVKENRIDVLFLQENKESPKSKTWEDLLQPYYTIVKEAKNESAIIYRTERFQKEDQLFKINHRQKLNFNQDTAFVKLGSYILISSHLTSKKQENKTQKKDMLEKLKELYEEGAGKFPPWKVIVGADINSFIEQKEFSQYLPRFERFPKIRTDITTAKKRTSMQVQTEKSNMVDIECKDSILTTQIIIGSLSSIDSIKPATSQEKRQSQKQRFLPNDRHPFDHYMIFTEIQIR